jgi:glutathione peroxidase
MSSLYSFPLRTLDGKPSTLARYRGRVLLIVNTASRCGFTPQYQGLEQLHREYEPQGLTVLGFPCNQFGGQEPGTAQDIQEFCAQNYDVTFPLFDKIDVNGPNAHPLFRLLKAEAKGILGTESIKWNFTKFLVDRAGRIVSRHGSKDPPSSLRREIETLLRF